jgi:hypothetical protein
MSRDKVNCWPCSEFMLDNGYYFCKRGVKSFPKRCGHFEYEPGSDYDERLYEKLKGERDNAE